MKRLYSFTINQEKEVEKEIESKNENNEIVVTKRKEKQVVPYNFFIAKPTRSLGDNANLYNSTMVSDGLRKGLLSIFQLDKKYREDGVFTEDDNKKYKELCDLLIKSVEELQKINVKPETERTDEEKTKWKEITDAMQEHRLKLKEYENIKSNLYSHSAEYRARNMTINWWMLNLSYKEDGGKEVLFLALYSAE